jgi:hypothetical protein
MTTSICESDSRIPMTLQATMSTAMELAGNRSFDPERRIPGRLRHGGAEGDAKRLGQTATPAPRPSGLKLDADAGILEGSLDILSIGTIVHCVSRRLIRNRRGFQGFPCLNKSLSRIPTNKLSLVTRLTSSSQRLSQDDTGNRRGRLHVDHRDAHGSPLGIWMGIRPMPMPRAGPRVVGFVRN